MMRDAQDRAGTGVFFHAEVNEQGIENTAAHRLNM